LTKEIVEKKYVSEKIKVPYIPGCLAFREIPLFLKAYEKVETDVDVLFFDGNGYLHPRHMGLATHAGIVIGKPTIGIAKSYFKINDVDFTMPDLEENSFTDIIISGEVYGRVLRTHEAVKPIFVSIGNKIDLDTATQMASALVTKDSHIPIPTRLADIMTHEVRKAEKDAV
jgi:deoxyribonuclease V